MSQALHPMLNIAIKAARSAGAIINRAALDLEVLKIGTKGPNDYVSEVDRAAEDIIIQTLLEAYPGHGILAEESGRAHGAKNSEYVWIIDPLDGTTNFLHGFPVYAVSIALAHRGVVQQAVVYDPTRNDLYFASKGRGAFCNDRRLRVSKRTRISDSLIGTGFPFRNAILAPYTRLEEPKDAAWVSFQQAAAMPTLAAMQSGAFTRVSLSRMRADAHVGGRAAR
jgi:myo-inositol-1(or 4)-monophosphatase